MRSRFAESARVIKYFIGMTAITSKAIFQLMIKRPTKPPMIVRTYVTRYRMPLSATPLIEEISVVICTVVTDTPIGIGIMFVWSIIELISSSQSNKVGSYGFSLLIRHNMLGGRQYMVASISELWANRIAYVTLSLILMVACVFIYNMKRSGKYVTRSYRKHIDVDEVPDSVTS